MKFLASNLKGLNVTAIAVASGKLNAKKTAITKAKFLANNLKDLN